MFIKKKSRGERKTLSGKQVLYFVVRCREHGFHLVRTLDTATAGELVEVFLLWMA